MPDYENWALVQIECAEKERSYNGLLPHSADPPYHSA